jgi:hypothetical protein
VPGQVGLGHVEHVAGLAGHAAPWPALALSAVVAVLAWLASRWLVTRTRAHLEDFL